MREGEREVAPAFLPAGEVLGTQACGPRERAGVLPSTQCGQAVAGGQEAWAGGRGLTCYPPSIQGPYVWKRREVDVEFRVKWWNSGGRAESRWEGRREGR